MITVGATRAILRLVKQRIGEPALRKVEPPKGFLFVTSQESVDIVTYPVSLDYLLVQPEGYSDVFKYTSELKIAQEPWQSYCQWHNGPLDEADDPLKRLYCPVAAEGFCSKHRRSERAIYTLCLDSRSEKALEACKYIDSVVKGEYVVYMLDYGGDKPKVGATRKFRLLERIAEQPHVVATVIMEVDSLLAARKAEMRISSSGIAVESWRHKLLNAQDHYFASLRLSEAASKASKLLGVQWDNKLFSIVSQDFISMRPRVVDAESLVDKSLIPWASWGGFIMFKDSGGSLVAVKSSQLMHKNSLIVDLGST